MDKKAWATPLLRQLNIRAATEASFPPGSPDNFATSDSYCPEGPLPTPDTFCVGS